MLQRLFSHTVRFFLLLAAAYLLQANWRLYYRPQIRETAHSRYNADVYQQLQFLKQALHDGNAGADMQQAYPEGYLFLHSLYGLAWCNLIRTLPHASGVFREGLAEADWALRQVQTPSAKSTFPENLPLEYGAFYQGWTTYLWGQKLALLAPEERNEVEMQQFQAACGKIAAAIATAAPAYLESYTGSAWPADNVVCLAVLALHDRMAGPVYNPLIQGWLHAAQASSDRQTGLLPHAATPPNDPAENVRGSSQSLMLVFLSEIDPAFARRQLPAYLEAFLDFRFGLPGIREYRKGHTGPGDGDSGPVVLGIGGAASIVGIAALERLGRPDLSRRVRNAVEAVACPISTSQTKRYFFGQVPVADAFLAWSQSFAPAQELPEPHNWPWLFQACSLLLGTGLYGFYRWMQYLLRQS